MPFSPSRRDCSTFIQPYTYHDQPDIPCSALPEASRCCDLVSDFPRSVEQILLRSILDGARIRHLFARKSLMLHIFVFLFGVLFLLSVVALVRQLVAEHLGAEMRIKTLCASPEGWLLFVAAVTISFRSLSDLILGPKIPGIGSGWIWGYGICCGVYLAVKGIRMFLIHA